MINEPESARDVLESVFRSSFDEKNAEHVALAQSPSYGELLDFAELLVRGPTEEDAQTFLARHPKFLMGLFGFADDSVLAVISKPSIGGHFFADFGVLLFGQGGCTIALVEIEPVADPLFTKKLSPARRYQAAITQIQEWNEWIQPNLRTFVKDTVEYAISLPLYPERTHNGSFRIKSGKYIDEMWRGFGGYDEPFIHFAIVMGRWSRLSQREKKRLLSNNRHNNKLYMTYTYEQLMRRGIERPFLGW
jgi:hypothetical protein